MKTMTPMFQRLAMAMCCVLPVLSVTAQTRVVSGLNFKYQDGADRSDFRLSTAEDLDFALYYYDSSTALFDSDGPNILAEYGIDDADATTIVNMTGGVTPCIRYWASEDTRFYLGSVFDRGRQEFRGQGQDTLELGPFALREVVHVERLNRMAFRLGMDKILKRYYFRAFNLEAYWGGALQFGRTKSVNRYEKDYQNGDFDYETVKSNFVNYGIDGYIGLTLRGNKTSLGLEILMLGLERKSNMGITTTEFNYRFGETLDSGVVVTAGNENYESASATSSGTTMYQGVRLVAAIHL